MKTHELLERIETRGVLCEEMFPHSSKQVELFKSWLDMFAWSPERKEAFKKFLREARLRPYSKLKGDDSVGWVISGEKYPDLAVVSIKNRNPVLRNRNPNRSPLDVEGGQRVLDLSKKYESMA